MKKINITAAKQLVAQNYIIFLLLLLIIGLI